jgi:hypothetical protein
MVLRPAAREAVDAPAHIKYPWIRSGSLLFDQLYGLLRRIALGNQDTGAHRRAAVDPAGTVGVDCVPPLDGLQGLLHSPGQLLGRDGQQR